MMTPDLYAGKGNDKAIKLNIMALVVFLCGAVNDVSLKIIGEFYVSEMLVLLVAIFALILSKNYEAYNARLFNSFLVVGCISLLGYMLSDIYVGTLPSQYLKGWGRIIILISDCFAIMLLAMKGRQNIWWFILGSGVGGIVHLYITGVPFHIWKLGYGEKVTMIFLTMIIFLPKRLWVVSLLGYGLFNIVLDYRSMGAGLVLTAAIMFVGTIKSSKRFMVLIVAGSVMLATLITVVTLTRDENIAHRTDSDIGRTSGIIVSLRAIMKSPLIGYGSWTISEKFSKELRDEIKKRRQKAEGNIDFTRLGSGSGFRAHSQILQSWVEGGFLGAVFFLFYGYKLFQSILWCSFKRVLDTFTPVFTYTIIMGVWNLFMSPFLGFGRMQIALAVSIIVLLLIEKQTDQSVLPSAKIDRKPLSQPRLLNIAKANTHNQE